MADDGSGSGDKIIYPIAIAQFLLGVLITVINTLMVANLITTEKLRKDASQCLLTNMWFVNLLLGIIVAVVNVVETGGAVVINGKPITMVVMEKPKGTIAIINSMVTLATLLTLITDRLLIVRANKKGMTLKRAAIAIAAIWSTVFVLTFIKAIVSSLNKYNGSTCWVCFLNFEVAILILLGIVAIFFFIITLVKLLVRKKHAVSDGSHSAQRVDSPEAITEQKNQVKITITIGIMLIVFLFVMSSYVLMQAVWLYNRIDSDASEIIICIFYLHCLINPAILLCRDKETRECLRRLVTCKGKSNNMNNNNIEQNHEISNEKPFQQGRNMQINDTDPGFRLANEPRNENGRTSVLPPLRSETPPKNVQDLQLQSMSEFRKPSAPPPDDHEKTTMAISHIETPPHRFGEQNIGFVENGDMVQGHM